MRDRASVVNKTIQMENDKELQFIGMIHSQLNKIEDCPRQGSENAPAAVVEIFNGFVEGIENVKPGDAIILFTWLDKADRSVLKTRPRNDNNLPLTGVFSTRSPDRPNPVGVHFVTVTSILADNSFSVSNLEVLDGTPVIDIKPDL